MAPLPMFPLGTVLVPHQVLPLHVFEPRYRALVHDCLAGDGELGVVLIERGSEVGGGDQRTSVGTVAQIAEAARLPDGRWALAVVGDRRLQVRGWLPDDPYPRAEVDDWPDEPSSPEALAGALDRIVPVLRRALALAAELGDPVVPATVELAEDPEVRAWQCTVIAPLGPLDRQALLASPAATTRMDALGALLDDAVAGLELRMGG